MKKLIIIPVLTMLFFAGCRSTKPVQNNFFILELPSSLVEDARIGIRTIDATCEIRKVEVAPPYASHQIAIREDTHRIRYFSFNEWAYRPDLSLTNMTLSFLEKHRFFREIVTGRLQEAPDYTLKTTVHRLEVDHLHEAFEARLMVEFVLLETATAKPVIHHRADRTRTLEENSLNLFAGAVSDLFSEELVAFMNLVMKELAD